MNDQGFIEILKKSYVIEIELLKSWNHVLIPIEPSRKIMEFVLGVDPNMDIERLICDWSKGKNELSSYTHSVYSVQTSSGRELLEYYINVDDECQFEYEMSIVWGFLEEVCYDKEWWIGVYDENIEESPFYGLILDKK